MSKGKSSKKNKDYTDDFKSPEARKKGDLLLNNTFDKIGNIYSGIYLSVVDEQDQDDRGIDFQVEIVLKAKNETIEVFKLQNKGTLEPVKLLKTTQNKGLISFQISLRHVKYYRNEMPYATMFMLCDVPNEKVYWHPIQLDENVDERVDQAEKEGHESVQIYINPKHELNAVNFEQFLEQIRGSKKTQFYKTTDRDNPLFSDGSEFEVDENKPLLDQVYDLFEYLYDEIRYVPQHLLIRNKPFKKANSYIPFIHSFKATTDNAELVELFASIKVNDDHTLTFTKPALIKGVADADRKAKVILRKFSENQIYWIGGDSGKADAPLRYFPEQECDCVACRYYRLDILGAIKSLDSKPKDDLLDQMKFAYMHYQLGNYIKAAEMLKDVASAAKRSNKSVIYTITQFNLLKLGRLIKNSYFDYQITNASVDFLKIDLDKTVLSSLTKGHNLKLAMWIKNQNFINEPAYQIHESVGKIRNTYQSYIDGNVSRNRHFYELIDSIAQLNSFVNGNYIIFDRWGEYKQLFDTMTEGLFAAYAMKEEQRNNLRDLNDYHIFRMIFDGSQENIWRYFNKYRLTSVSYKAREKRNNLFLMVKNVLGQNHLINDALKIYSPEDGFFWRSTYPFLFANTLCLAAIIEMDDHQAETIISQIVDCLGNGPLHSPDCYVNVNAFIVKKHPQLSDSTLKKLFIFCVRQKDAYAEARMNIVSNTLKFRGIEMKLSKTDEIILMDCILNDDDKRENNIRVYVYPVVEQRIQKKIVKHLEKMLNKKFDAYQYYYAKIYDLPLNQSYFDQFISQSVPDPHRPNIQAMLGAETENKYPMFDMLLNLCFKNDLDLKSITKVNFSGYGDYYDWLLDMDNFDYSKFRVRWIGLYATKFYFNEFRKHPKIKTILEAYLKSKRDIRIERLYIDLYNPLNIESVED
ncbi:hypothetical protein ABIC74_000818 [Mucilaginibacter rubeus]|uniref:DUF4365 domain-containing protein n=1 Tax=Mucilaginibacter rubeus TaxID=2027860 RepID=UPI0033956134